MPTGFPRKTKARSISAPIYFATDEVVGVHASESYTFAIITSPSGPYYSNPVKIWVEEQYVRAVQGGMGDAKNRR